MMSLEEACEENSVSERKTLLNREEQPDEGRAKKRRQEAPEHVREPCSTNDGYGSEIAEELGKIWELLDRSFRNLMTERRLLRETITKELRNIHRMSKSGAPASEERKSGYAGEDVGIQAKL